MKITKEIIQKIEGEANLEIEWQNDKINFAKIKFLNFRGIEKILENREFLDALAITPRVCGICNTSHTIASINAIENAYENMGIKINLSDKAKQIREYALNAEKIQNHIKWLFFAILPEMKNIDKEFLYEIKSFKSSLWIEAQQASSDMLKSMALFTGQWPHGSFCITGGVTCDPTKSDVFEAQRYLENCVKFCEKKIFGTNIEDFFNIKTLSDLIETKSLFSDLINTLIKNGFAKFGQSYDRFISFGNNTIKNSSKKCIETKITNVDVNFVKESLLNSFFQEDGYTYSKSAMYKDDYYEVGPSARMMINKNALSKDVHRKYKDSIMLRVVSRIAEIAYLIKKSRTILDTIILKEKSCNNPHILFKNISSNGIGFCEAARGSLIHKIEINTGLIKSYDIITPTVWNLGNGTHEYPSIIQKALIGQSNMDEANFIFKCLDVCSVCTTQ